MSEQKAETWKSLPNYENRYAISNYGRIKNIKNQSALTVDGCSYYLGVFNCPTAAYIKREVAFRVFNGRLS